MLGFLRFAQEVHLLEDLMADSGGAWPKSSQEGLVRAWEAATAQVRPLIDNHRSGVILHEAEYASLLDELRRQGAAPSLIALAESWTTPSLSGTFASYERLVDRLSAAKGKRVRVVHQGGHTRARGVGQDDVVAALIHVIRNAMEHAFEGPEERAAQGKPPEGTLVLTAEDQGSQLRIVITDDGRGIDLDAVRANGARVGITPEDDLFGCLCAGSTRSEANLEAGRGVGVAALRDKVDAIGGSVAVHTQVGAGTRFEVVVPTLRGEELALAAR